MALKFNKKLFIITNSLRSKPRFEKKLYSIIDFLRTINSTFQKTQKIRLNDSNDVSCKAFLKGSGPPEATEQNQAPL